MTSIEVNPPPGGGGVGGGKVDLYKYQERQPPAISLHLTTAKNTSTTMDVMIMGELEQFDTNNISQADVEKLRKMLPMELQQPGKLTQLEIILEAIHYIKMLQNKLGCL